MKKLLTIIIASAILYLLFAFVTLSFNPFNWQEITRAFYVSLLIIIDFAILTSPKDLFKSSVDWLAEQLTVSGLAKLLNPKLNRIAKLKN